MRSWLQVTISLMCVFLFATRAVRLWGRLSTGRLWVGSCSQHVNIFLGKILNPKVLRNGMANGFVNIFAFLLGFSLESTMKEMHLASRHEV